jgi:hypothetical protein
MITKQQYEEALELIDKHFKKQGMSEEDWKNYKEGGTIKVRYEQQELDKKMMKMIRSRNEK